MAKGQNLYKKAKTLIPGGTQLLSKRPEMHLPELWPSYYEKAKGCEIWDLDGKKYIDMSFMGVGACVLGYADSDVNKAVKQAIDKGSATTLNCYEEVELAEKFIELHPWAEMARFARTGGEAMAIAVRIARASTKKDKVLFCGYHGWHDWYLASNLSNDSSLDGHLMPGLQPTGVPRVLRGTSFPFEYNNVDKFLKLIEEHDGDIAAVVVEPIRNFHPAPGFLETIRKITKEKGIVFIIDEVSSGFRMNTGGAHLLFGIKPDIAVFSKALGNGFPVAAIIGRKKVMTAAEESFISSTGWTERVGTVAALATIKKYQAKNVGQHLQKIGKMVQDGWAKSALKNGLHVHITGMYPIGHFEFEYKKPLVLKTLFTELMLKKGYLASNAYYASYAHKISDIRSYLLAVDEVFAKISKTLDKGDPEKVLECPVCHSGFRRLN